MSISDNFNKVKNNIPELVKLVVVTKFQEKENILEVYNCNQRDFAENKVQEIIRKKDLLPYDINWHMIGHLQTNKVKYIANFISMIQSVDSLKLLEEINKQAKKHNRAINCLLQFYIAKEETKFGLSLNEASEIIQSEIFQELKNINICGVMGMASFTENMNIVEKEFFELQQIFTHLKNNYFKEKPEFKEISMGMSGDFKLAIEKGSTIIRVGSIIFNN